MNILPCGFLTTNSKGKIIFINRYLTELLRLKEEDIVGRKSIADFFPVGGKVYFETHVRPLLLMQLSVEEISMELLRPDKSRVPVSLNGIIKTDEHDGDATIYYTIFDISQRKKYERELLLAAERQKRQNDRLSNLAYVFSHNVRSHVANISGIISITDMDDRENRNWAFDMLAKSADALDDTIQHLSSILTTRDNINLPTELLNVRDEIEKVLKILQLSVSSANATVHYNIGGGRYLTTNPAYFESVVLNLLSNAIKYRSLDRNPEIHISLSREGNFKILEVKDNGLGIDLNKYGDQLFGMYKTFHGNEDAKGLGLSIVKAQVEAMKGKIEVESSVEVGTTFRVYFLT